MCHRNAVAVVTMTVAGLLSSFITSTAVAETSAVEVSGLRLEVPEGWQTHPIQATDGADNTRVVGRWDSRQTPSSLVVGVVERQGAGLPMTLTAVHDHLVTSLNRLSSSTRGEMLSLIPERIDDFPAYRAHLRLRRGVQDLHQTVYIVDAGKTYVLSFVSLSETQEASADAIVKSVSFNKPPTWTLTRTRATSLGFLASLAFVALVLRTLADRRSAARSAPSPEGLQAQ